MEESKRAVIYTRVSRDDTGEGASNRRQETECRRLTEYRRWDVVDVVDDISTSAYKRGVKRPGWQRVLAMVEAGEVDVIVAYHLDRITRNMRDLEDLLDLVEIHRVGTVTVVGDIDMTGDMGRMIARILAAVATAEVERKGKRQKDANSQRLAEGKRWASGWRPFGYELDGSMIPQEADLVRDAAQDVLAGTPLREIARRWRETGISTPRSEKGADGWTHHGVRSILLNPRNAALNTYKGAIVGPGAWEPILTEETHIRLVAKLTNPQRKTHGSSGRLAANLLSGIAVCNTCEEPVTGGTVGRTKIVDGKRVSTGRRVAVYKCRNNHLSTDREEVDNLVIGAFAATISMTTASTQLMPIDRQGRDAGELSDSAEQLTQSIKELATSFADGRVTLSQMEIATAALNEKLTKIEKEIAQGSSGDADVRELINANTKKWLSLDTATRRKLLAQVARIRLYPKGRGRKSVPVKHQVTMDLVTYQEDGSERLLHALAERPPDLGPVNTQIQVRQRARPVPPVQEVHA